MADQYSINGSLTLSADEFNKTIERLKSEHAGFAKQFKKGQTEVNEDLKSSEKIAKGFGDSFTKQFALANIASSSLMKGMALLKNNLGSVTAEYLKLDKNLAKVRTLTQDVEFSTAMYRDELFKVSEATGYFSSDLAEASYQALSAGVAVEDLGGFISQMAIAAKGGFTDVTTAVDATTSVMNAYGVGVYTAQEITDKFIATQNRGKTTFDELGKSAALFIPIAAQLNIELDEVLGMMASITRVGVPTAQAATQINRVMLELADSASGAGKEFKELTGKSFSDFSKEGGNLTQALKILNIGAQDSGRELVTMFGRAEAGKAAVVLMKDSADDLAISIESVGNSAGATEKANKIATTNVIDEWTKLKTSVINDIVEIGKAEEGFMYSFAKFLNETRSESNKELEEHNKNYSAFEERRIQLQEKYQREGLYSVQAYVKARNQAIEEQSRLGTTGLVELTENETYVAPKSQSEIDAEEEESLRKYQELARKKALEDLKVANALKEGERLKAIEQAKQDEKKAALDAIAARKAEAEANKAFDEQLQIEGLEFNTQQLTDQFNFMQAQAELRDQGKITKEEFEEEAKEFLQEQLIEADQQRIDELQKEAEYYENKKNMQLEYNTALYKLKVAEIKLIKDSAKEKEQANEEESELYNQTEKFISASYNAIMDSHGNFLEDMANFFTSFLGQMMIAFGERLVVDGTMNMLFGKVKVAGNAVTNPPVAAEGLMQSLTAGQEIAAGLAMGATGAAISSIDVGGSSSSSDDSDSDTTTDSSSYTSSLDSTEKKATITYMVSPDSELLEILMPKMGQYLKDDTNVTVIPTK